MKGVRMVLEIEPGKIAKNTSRAVKAKAGHHFVAAPRIGKRVISALEGQRFPLDEGAPGEGLPGEPILCRCFAEPVLDPIMQAIS